MIPGLILWLVLAFQFKYEIFPQYMPSTYDTYALAHTKWNCKYHIVFAPKYRTVDAGSLSGESGLTEDTKNEAIDSGLTKDPDTKSVNKQAASATTKNRVNEDIPKYVEFDSRTVSHWVFINEKDVLNEDFAFVLENVQPSPAQLCPYFSDMVHKRYIAKYKSGRNYTVGRSRWRYHIS